MFDSDLETAAVAFFAEVSERHATEAVDAYAVELYIDFQDDDVRRPVVTAGFNSEAGIEAALGGWPGVIRRRRVPADEEEARWDFAFWSHNDLARFGDPVEDPDSATALERWIRLNGWWFTDEEEQDTDLERTLALGDEIQAGLDRVMTVVARELQTGPWSSTGSGRPSARGSRRAAGGAIRPPRVGRSTGCPSQQASPRPRLDSNQRPAD